MAKAKLLQPTMTAGELSPELYGRVDLARYMTAMRKVRNWIVRPYGGLENRPGWRYVSNAGDDGQHRNIPFVYSTETSYVLVFGHYYVRFLSYGAEVTPPSSAWVIGDTYALDQYVTDGGTTYRSLQPANVGNTPASSPLWWVADSGLQITTPWSGVEIWNLRYTQSADVMYFVCGTVRQHTLARTAANVFALAPFENSEGPFLDLNADQAVQVAASGTQGLVELTANAPVFTADDVGGLFYLEPEDLGNVPPWVVGDKDVAVGSLRRSDGKTYQAVQIAAGGSWTETGPRTPVHESGRAWDGPNATKTNGVSTWAVGVLWEFIDTGHGVVEIESVTDPMTAAGTVTKRLPSGVVGGFGTASNTWAFAGDGVAQTFAIAGAGYGVYRVLIDGVRIQSNPYYNPRECVSVDARLPGGIRAGDVRVGDTLALFDPVTWAESWGTVTYSERALVEGWTIETACGARLACSATAPIPVHAGGYRTPAELVGHEVPVWHGGRRRWDVVVHAAEAGPMQVQHITVGDRCFWAGELHGSYILHHNAKYSGVGGSEP